MIAAGVGARPHDCCWVRAGGASNPVLLLSFPAGLPGVARCRLRDRRDTSCGRGHALQVVRCAEQKKALPQCNELTSSTVLLSTTVGRRTIPQEVQTLPSHGALVAICGDEAVGSVKLSM